MIEKHIISECIQAYLDMQEQQYELITLHVSPANEILVEVDSYEPVDVDFCAALSRHIVDSLESLAVRSGQKLDYSLEVGSVGLTDPFKTKMQYDKHVGDDVEVLTKDGRKLYGQLVDVQDESFAIDTEVMVAVEGKKRKQKEIQTLTFGYGDVKYTRYDLKV